MSEINTEILRKALNEKIGVEEEEPSAAQEFFKKFPPEKKIVLLTDVFGIEGAEAWSPKEVESYFDRNAENMFDAAINNKEIRDFFGVSREELIQMSEEGEDTLDELVDDDGSFIGNGSGSDRPKSTNDSEIWTAPQQTTNDFASSAVQPNRFRHGYFGAPAGQSSVGESKESFFVRESKTKKVLEDLLNQKKGGDDLVKKQTQPDINKNKIPDIGELFTKNNKASVAKNVDNLIYSMNSNKVDGEELAMIINSILKNYNIEIPENYKKKLREKLK